MTQINSGSFPKEGPWSTGRGANNAPQCPLPAINFMPAQRTLLAGRGAPFATPRPAGFILLQNDLEDRSCLIQPPLRDRPHFRSGKDDPPLYSIWRSRSHSRGNPPVCSSSGRTKNCSGRPRVEPCPETARKRIPDRRDRGSKPSVGQSALIHAHFTRRGFSCRQR